jgi:hypothetical protein
MSIGRWKTPEAKQRSLAALRKTSAFAGKRWLTNKSIPEKAHPLVREFFRLLNDEQAHVIDVCRRSGIQRGTISSWRVRSHPAVGNFQAALNSIGYELVIKPIIRSGRPKSCVR